MKMYKFDLFKEDENVQICLIHYCLTGTFRRSAKILILI